MILTQCIRIIFVVCLFLLSGQASASGQTGTDPFRLDPNEPAAQDASTGGSGGASDSQEGESGSTTEAGEEGGEQGLDEAGDPDADTVDESNEQDTLAEVGQTTQDAADALASGDLAEAASKSGELLTKYGIPALIALAIVIVAFFFASFLSRIVSLPIRKKVDETLGRFVGKMVFYSVMACSILGVLQYFGVGVSSFAAVIAAAGFAVGLAFQGTLSNFAAGVMLLVFRPFKVGDVVNAAGITAKIHMIDLFTTVFDTPDNRRIIVPNGAIVGSTIENISFHSERRVDVAVGVDYSASIGSVRRVLETAAESCRDVLLDGEDRGYQIVLGELGDSAVGWTVRFWVKADDYWPTKERLTEAVKTHLDDAGIGIPFPQMDVHVHQSN